LNAGASTAQLPGTATVPAHDTTETVMGRRFDRAAFTKNGIREAATAKVCSDPMVGRRHPKVGPFLGLRTDWRDELAEAASSVVGGGNNRCVSHVSQPQDGPERVSEPPTLVQRSAQTLRAGMSITSTIAEAALRQHGKRPGEPGFRAGGP
jgi:hypothetical protein